ncbi:PAAR motif protein [compost metagenome]
MSGKPAARLTDPTACPQNGHGSNPIVQGSSDVLFDGLPAARQGDATACGGTLSGKLIGNVLINGRPAAVLGSQGDHGNLVIGGSATVVIGTTYVPAPVAVTPSAAQAWARPAFPAAGAWQAPPGEPVAAELEEEEEEEELEDERLQGIVLRIGMFFDGTGNNLGNSAVTERCRRDDRELLDERTLAETVAHCAAYGYRDGALPDDSYGNAASNVALLYELYRDDSTRRLEPAGRSATLAVYPEGIGTRSGGSDSVVGSASGLGETGVLERVRQSPASIQARLALLLVRNPDLSISAVEFDLFGFSRGAAAARHFANEVLKDQGGVLQATLNARAPGFAGDFSWARTRLNFIGLFDCVAAIVAPQSGDRNPLNKLNPGVNLYLPPGCAGQVVQLVARDERRWNFALNSVRSGPLAAGQAQHREIVLPGVHWTWAAAIRR